MRNLPKANGRTNIVTIKTSKCDSTQEPRVFRLLPYGMSNPIIRLSVLTSIIDIQDLPLYTGFIQFGAGLSVGLAGLAAGFAIGIVGDAGVRGTAQQPRLFVGMILILIFAEVLGMC